MGQIIGGANGLSGLANSIAGDSDALYLLTLAFPVIKRSFMPSRLPFISSNTAKCQTSYDVERRTEYEVMTLSICDSILREQRAS